MALNSSGPISLAGATTGQSIEKELGGDGITVISLNDTTVRALAGVASGQISMPSNFWGKSAGNYWIGNLVTGATNSGIQGATVDSSGNIYFGGLASGGAFLIKLNNAGVYQWGNTLFSSVASASFSILNLSILNNGNIAVAGQVGYTSNREAAMRFEVNASTGATVSCYGTTPGTGGDTNSYIVKQTTDGSVYMIGNMFASTNSIATVMKFSSMSSTPTVWHSRHETTQGGWRGGDIDSSGNIIVVGVAGSATTNRPYIYKYNPSGTLLWGKGFAASAANHFYQQVKCFGTNSYVSGYYISGSQYNLLTQKFDSTGAVIWSKAIVQPDSLTSFNLGAINVDSSENIYVCANISINSVNSGLLILKYNSSGVLQWQRTFNRGVRYANINLMNDSTFVVACGITNTIGNYNFLDGNWICALPTDGSKTGTYTVNGKSVTYAISTYTEIDFNTTYGGYVDIVGATLSGISYNTTLTSQSATDVVVNI